MKRDEEILGMNITINAIESCTHIPDCMPEEVIRSASTDDEHLNNQNTYCVAGCQ